MTRAVSISSILRDQAGAVMVEVTLVGTMMFVLILGSVDILNLIYQWNAASKAVQVGARLAAVSDPVAAGLSQLSNAMLEAAVPAGGPMPSFAVVCNGGTRRCACDPASVCRAITGYDQAAMNTIVFGRASSSCSDARLGNKLGMCDVFSRITPANVLITYTQTGLGYVGRPGGPLPTVTVQLQNLPFQFFFLGGLLRFGLRQIPASPVAMTAGDLSSHEPTF